MVAQRPESRIQLNTAENRGPSVHDGKSLFRRFAERKRNSPQSTNTIIGDFWRRPSLIETSMHTKGPNATHLTIADRPSSAN